MRLRTPQQRRLAAIDLFVGCTAAQITALDRLGTEVALAESTTLCREAVTPAQFVVVLSGRVQLRRGEQHVLTLTPGAWFGHVALLAGAPAEHVSAVAVVPTRVLVFSRREFFSMLAGAPTVAATLRAGESARVAAEAVPGGVEAHFVPSATAGA